MACIDPLQNFRLRLEIDNIARAGLSEFASDATTIDVIDVREATDSRSFEKGSGLTKCGSITLKSGLTAGANLLDPSKWRNDVSAGQNKENRMKVVIQDESGCS
jgi:phage tail-like protein